MSNPILEYQEGKRQLVLRVTESDLIPDDLALTKEDLTPEAVKLIRKNFNPDNGLSNRNCLNCSIYEIGKAYADRCKGCSYVKCGIPTLWGKTLGIWDLRATKEDRNELYALGEKLEMSF